MAKLINVIKDGKGQLEKRQLPLVIDEKLTMVLDLIDVDFMCEYPKIRGKDKELFLRKFGMLNVQELKEAFQVSCKRLLDIVSEIVPCVGCRRSVERVFHQMKTGPGRSALYPLVVTPDGVLVLPEDVYKWPNVIGAMFHNHVVKLNNLSTSWSRSKKSSRCVLHSLDAQRYVRPPLGSGWRLLWECMVPFCKQEVATIDISQLLSTLETYLQKHRFCTDCRTKVMKAYSLLVDDTDDNKGENTDTNTTTSSSCERSCKDHCHNHEETNTCGLTVKEKGFIPSLYAGIRRCSPKNHIHVDQRTDYIMGLILAAEPELLGNRRDRHAKTLENAQEEVLVCVGLCLYEKVHRIQLRLREEETTCQLLALVAINALSTNFQLAVENKQGISQLELLYEEFNREELLKQRKKQVRKLKKRRKKEKKIAAIGTDLPGEDDDVEREKDDNFDDQKEDSDDDDDDDEAEIIKRPVGKNKSRLENGPNSCNNKTFYRSNNDSIIKLVRNDMVSGYREKKEEICCCSTLDGTNMNVKNNKRMKSPTVEPRLRTLDKNKKMITSTAYNQMRNATTINKNCTKSKGEKASMACRPVCDFVECSTNNSASSNIYSKYNDKDTASRSKSNVIVNSAVESTASCDCCTEIQFDCGYGSADNNAISSSNGSGDSSVDSSEVACSEGFCNHDGSEECTYDIRNIGTGEQIRSARRVSPSFDQIKNSVAVLSSASRSLQQMLTETSVERKGANVNQRITECIIPVEEIQRYKSSMGRINEKREQLRQTLRNRFAQLCSQQQKPETLSAI